MPVAIVGHVPLTAGRYWLDGGVEHMGGVVGPPFPAPASAFVPSVPELEPLLELEPPPELEAPPELDVEPAEDPASDSPPCSEPLEPPALPLPIPDAELEASSPPDEDTPPPPPVTWAAHPVTIPRATKSRRRMVSSSVWRPRCRRLRRGTSAQMHDLLMFFEERIIPSTQLESDPRLIIFEVDRRPTPIAVDATALPAMALRDSVRARKARVR
jgi:hypothetical protein